MRNAQEDSLCMKRAQQKLAFAIMWASLQYDTGISNHAADGNT